LSTLRIENLVKKFDSSAAAAVSDVTLAVESGSFVVLLGPSGCGKTTTLRCIAGLETPDSGDIYIDSARVNDLPPKERDIAMVFQNYALYPHMTVYDNIGFPLKMRHESKSEIDNRVKETARLANIEPLLQRKPRQLSGGEQQRVALARAIVRKPKVFLMDEPLSNLDAKLRLYTRTEIKRLQKDLNVTTIYVTHDQSEAMAMSDKIAVMSKGKLLQYDSPVSVYNKPATTFVAGFIGSPPMNLIEMTLTEQNNGILLDEGEFKYELPSGLVGAVKGKTSGKDVLLGVRPEDLRVSISKEQFSIFQSEVYVLEPMGPQNVVDLKLGNTILKAVTPNSLKLDTGQRVWIGWDPATIHVFDSSSGQLLV
jgi:multiple sugar transport system ATP-binding protein